MDLFSAPTKRPLRRGQLMEYQTILVPTCCHLILTVWNPLSNPRPAEFRLLEQLESRMSLTAPLHLPLMQIP